MKNKIDLAVRLLLGLPFLVFGLNGFLHFIPMPEPSPAAGAFFGALIKTGYFLPVLNILEIVSGALLLSGFFVPLALTILAPIVVHIFLFHIFLDISGIGLAVAVLIMEVYLVYVYKNNFKSLLANKLDE
ncbi:hypothetical protein BMS3Abin03_00587 [bacterium BMS3Abin03]|nr:hypothetical protein BMS3Abin03_00587 [bacterium BMS3Abin03]